MEALPEVYTARGLNSSTILKIKIHVDFACYQNLQYLQKCVKYEHKLKKVAFRCAGIAHNTEVDVTSQVCRLARDLCHAAHQHEKDATFHFFVA